MNILIKALGTTAIFAACVQATGQTTSQDPGISPEAQKAMQKIGSALRKLKGYNVETNVVTRAAVGAGRYREFRGTVEYTVAPPDRLFAHVQGAGLERAVYYDGATIAVLAPAQKKYALVEAPGTIATFRQHLEQVRGLELPIADLFAWGKKEGPVSEINEGRYAGTGFVAGRSCEHYTFSGEGVIWEVWADRKNLPCKLEMVDTRDSGLPGYSAEITWKSAGGKVQVPRFSVPAGMSRVGLGDLAENDSP
jgi:hypothetical protein